MPQHRNRQDPKSGATQVYRPGLNILRPVDLKASSVLVGRCQNEWGPSIHEKDDRYRPFSPSSYGAILLASNVVYDIESDPGVLPGLTLNALGQRLLRMVPGRDDALQVQAYGAKLVKSGKADMLKLFVRPEGDTAADRLQKEQAAMRRGLAEVGYVNPDILSNAETLITIGKVTGFTWLEAAQEVSVISAQLEAAPESFVLGGLIAKPTEMPIRPR